MFASSGKLNAWLVYISTDYVFDGTAPPYKEDAVPNPLNKYGKSKLEGENVVQIMLKGTYICILH